MNQSTKFFNLAKKIFLRLFLICFFLGNAFLFPAIAQYSISGNFPPLKSQLVKLVGFNGLHTYIIDSTKVSDEGNFILRYSHKDIGVGFVSDKNEKSYIVILEQSDVKIRGELLDDPASIETIKGPENIAFIKYAVQHSKRDQALNAWVYLENMYNADSLFLNQKSVLGTIQNEKRRIEKQDADFLESLPTFSYVRWYLPARKLISSVSTVAQFRIAEIPSTISKLRRIDYGDSKLYKSGLLQDFLESHYWLLENRGGLSLDNIYKDMNESTDIILNSLSNNDKLYGQVVKYLFEYFEKHSLINPSAHISLKALSQKEATLPNKLINQLETYRKMKIGNEAPNIIFDGELYQNGVSLTVPHSLSEIKSNYKLIIFGASWCAACTSEISDLLPLYPIWKLRGIEVVFVSLDSDKNEFQNFTRSFPFISYCDYKKWETQSAKNYYISSSPTVFIIDSNNKIILRPNSIKAADTWVNYYMKLSN